MPAEAMPHGCYTAVFYNVARFPRIYGYVPEFPGAIAAAHTLPEARDQLKDLSWVYHRLTGGVMFLTSPPRQLQGRLQRSSRSRKTLQGSSLSTPKFVSVMLSRRTWISSQPKYQLTLSP